MIRKLTGLSLITAIAATLLAGADAGAEEKKKLYRWVDKDGKVQFSDSLPPEAVDQARTEINAESGRATAVVDRAMTPEERAAWEREQAELERIRKQEELARQTEEAMISSFQTEDELRAAFAERIELKRQNIEAIEAGIAGQRASLARLLVEASESELAGTAVNPRHAQTIAELHREMGRQQQMLIVREAELAGMDAQLAHLLERFREAKGLPPAPDDAADAPAAAEPAAEPAPDADAGPAGGAG
ncbi:DUF4124 domain-containing protein [Arenimonas fontis]|nr:DUF4124 domain-containing protein [Arenimonas fontis]